MSFLRSIFAATQTTSDEKGWIASGTWGYSSAGINVSESVAMNFSSVFAAIKILAESIAQVPLVLYERLDDDIETASSGPRAFVDRAISRGRRPAIEHPVYFLLHNQPNELMTSYIWRETLQAHLGGWGNCYSLILFDAAGYPQSLLPIDPSLVTIDKNNSRNIRYRIRIDNESYYVFPERVLHVPALGFDGIVGYSPIYMARHAIGLGIAMEQFGAAFFKNGAKSGIALSHPARLSNEAVANIKKQWAEDYAGVERAHLPKVLQEGMTVSPLSIAPEDAQFLQSRKFQLAEIARFYRLPLHKFQELDQAKYANIEQQNIEFVTDSLMPWFVRWEQELERKLLTKKERQKYFIRFKVNGFLRGDATSRKDFYQSGITNGWLTRNEARELEDLNPIDGADELLIPLNMRTMSQGFEKDAENIN